ncbi:MAG: ABC transporter substrate-binding protein, partial [Proteobacteria bacterium]|nr:ABC transporter substrate-binding protein [Pseudomonadota bacterium]
MKKLLWTCLISLALTLGISTSAFAGEGFTDTEIHIGSWGPQTGPAAPWGTIPRGTDNYFKMINQEGGINGRKLVLHHFDDGYNPARTKAGVKQLQEGDNPMFAYVGGVGTSTGLAVVDYLMDRKIPWIGPASGSEKWVNPPRKYLFANYAPYHKEAMVLTKYAIENLGKKRIGVLYQNDDYGKGGLKGARAELKKHGMEPVLELPMEVKDKDMKPFVFKMKKANVDAVLLWTGIGQSIRVIGTAKAMRLSPQFLGTSTVSDFALMYKISKGFWEG